MKKHLVLGRESDFLLKLGFQITVTCLRLLAIVTGIVTAAAAGRVFVNGNHLPATTCRNLRLPGMFEKKLSSVQLFRLFEFNHLLPVVMSRSSIVEP